jgi:hypothetical protein
MGCEQFGFVGLGVVASSESSTYPPGFNVLDSVRQNKPSRMTLTYKPEPTWLGNL